MSWNPVQRPSKPAPAAPPVPAAPPPVGPPPPAYPPPLYPPPGYGYPAPYPYGYPPPGYGAPSAPTNGLAIASLVLGIAGIPLFTFYGVVPIVALILGAFGNAQIRRSAGRQGGKGMAIAGMILGGVGILFAIVFLILIVALVRGAQHGGGTFT